MQKTGLLFDRSGVRTSDLAGRVVNRITGLVASLFVLPAILAAPALAQEGAEAMGTDVAFGARKTFLMLFLMLGPIKILVPFVEMTHESEAIFRRKLATRAILFSAAALALAGLLGRSMIENLDISLPVLALTGGVILFIVALRTVLQQSQGSAARLAEGAGLHLALNPLAFPTIVTPYGIAAVIVFVTLAGGSHGAELMLAGILVAILAMDWVAMLFAETILRWVGTALQVFAVILGVAQIALGLQVILRSLRMIGVFVGGAA
jgi:multiple antibiotic resistance protein